MNIMNEMLELLADQIDAEMDAAWIHEGDQTFAELDNAAKATTEFYRGYVHALMEVATSPMYTSPSVCTVLAAQIYKRYLKGVDVYDGTPR